MQSQTETRPHSIGFGDARLDAVKIGHTRFRDSQGSWGLLDVPDPRDTGIGLLRLFLIVRIFDMISLFVTERFCRFILGNVPAPPSPNQYPLLRLCLWRAMIDPFQQ